MCYMTESSTDASGRSTTQSPPEECEDCGHTGFIPKATEAESGATEFAFHECANCGSRYNCRDGSLQAGSDLRVPTAAEIFGHPEPYPHQKEAIDDVLDVFADGGFMVMEGGCGTGKTMIALTAALTMVRNPKTPFEQILVLTSVKQQLRQFESDLRIINDNLPGDVAPAHGLTLVGKADLCPYSRENVAGISTDNVAGRCRNLRDSTSKLMSKWDGNVLASQAESGEGSGWSCGSVDVPFQDSIPEEEDIEYCPFYAKIKYMDDPSFAFGHTEDFILDPPTLVDLAVERGVCPHSAMSMHVKNADVIISNYYHAFDRKTLQITHRAIGPETLLICDEAHMMEPRVREILSTTATLSDLQESIFELSAILNVATSSEYSTGWVREPPRGIVQYFLRENGYPPKAISRVRSELVQLQQFINQTIAGYLNENVSSWRSNPNAVTPTDIPLRDPSSPGEQDVVSKWAERQGIEDALWQSLSEIADAVEDIFSTSDTGNSQPAFSEVAAVLDQWFERDHTYHFRQISLRGFDQPSATGDLVEGFVGSMEVQNVMPKKVIGSRLDYFGAGLLMSATLEPMDIYRDVTGLSYLQFDGRPVESRVYTADFPRENRLSTILDLPKFTNSNRGSVENLNDVRKQYFNAVKSVVQLTPGNVLVCMPSYREAQWIAAGLRQVDSTKAEILVDESSSEEETEKLKQRFFDGGPKVLATSMRGTLTEGVDFAGDKLLATVVCGLPVENVGSPTVQAVQTAYEEEFGGVGFQYGLTVPAVRKTRQALGRVIRGDDDLGVRVLLDERYSPDAENSIWRFFSEDEREEYEVMSDLGRFQDEIQSFWSSVDPGDI